MKSIVDRILILTTFIETRLYIIYDRILDIVLKMKAVPDTQTDVTTMVILVV